MSDHSKQGFAERVVAWQRVAGRHDLPWQRTRDPYLIWLSEIMLQQTQVAAVIPFYLRFVARFPNIGTLAMAPLDDVLALWSGLGYYARARNLHAAARTVMQRHAGIFPNTWADIVSLPGIGRSTAGAIAVFAFGARHCILDGNVKRVLARAFGIDGFPGEKKVEAVMWTCAETLLPARELEAYTQGLMDLGAGICTRARPRCEDCPLNEVCVARRQGRVSLLPTPRPRKALPEKSTVMLILRRGDEILLEKRPVSGIWGGLWSFPEIADLQDAAAVLQLRFGVQAVSEGNLTCVRHGFTHYALTITPALLRVTRLELRVQSGGQIWVTPCNAIHAAVPAPVRSLLQRLSSTA